MDVDAIQRSWSRSTKATRRSLPDALPPPLLESNMRGGGASQIVSRIRTHCTKCNGNSKKTRLPESSPTGRSGCPAYWERARDRILTLCRTGEPRSRPVVTSNIPAAVGGEGGRRSVRSGVEKEAWTHARRGRVGERRDARITLSATSSPSPPLERFDAALESVSTDFR